MKYEKVHHDPSIDSDHDPSSYFYSKGSPYLTIIKRQHGIVRTKCIDSLDGTNIIQSLIAHRVMDAVVMVMGVLDSIPEHMI